MDVSDVASVDWVKDLIRASPRTLMMRDAPLGVCPFQMLSRDHAEYQNMLELCRSCILKNENFHADLFVAAYTDSLEHFQGDPTLCFQYLQKTNMSILDQRVQ
jgi:hypothetical protein